jgi:sugar-specific transcriptional regulator TrmB
MYIKCMDTGILENIGFTKGEIKVYLALLELGSSTSGAIISKSKVSRSKVYEILERLKEKGVVSEVIKDQVKYFHSLTPKKILEYLKTKEQGVQQQKEEFQKFLPQLLAKQKFSGIKQDMKIYIGAESVKTYYEEMIDKLGNDGYIGTNFTMDVLNYKQLLLILHRFHKERAGRGIKVKILCNEGDMLNKRVKVKGVYEFRASPIVVPNNVTIFKDTVAYYHWGDPPKVFAINCKEIADDYRKFFYDVWKKSK